MTAAPRVAIVGSRRRADREAVAAAVAELPIGAVVISGGAKGPDTWAAEAAQARGCQVIVHRPDLLGGLRGRWDAAQRYYDRNQRIVEDCDRLIAFPAPERTGGTEDTIRRAVKAGKPVELR